MKTFKNVNFTRRDGECTNVVACQAEQPPGAQWVECDPAILAGLDQLWIQAGVRFFGYL
jgi:hypothetical protein